MDIRQCYKILEIDSDVSVDQLNQAYKDLVAVWHPDRFSGNHRLKEKAENKLKSINQAYETILSVLSSDPEAHPVKRSYIAPVPNENGLSGMRTSELRLMKRSIAPRTHPWVRLSGRIIDYVLFAGLLSVFHADDVLRNFGFRTILLPALLSFVWIIPEAVMVGLFGTSPGKWMLKTKIVDMFHVKPNFSDALKRSLSVWCNGLGMGVPFITPFTLGFAYYRLKTKKGNVWDRDMGLSVKHEPISRIRSVTAVLVSFTMIFLLESGSNIMVEVRRQVVRLQPEDPRTHLNLGDSYAGIGRYEEAIQSYQQALKIKPRYGQAHYALGRRFLDLRQYEEAVLSLEKAAAVDSENADIMDLLGSCLAELKRTREAVDAYGRAVKIKPDHVGALYGLGQCHMELKNHHDAIRFLQQVISLDAAHVHAHHSLGICHTKLGRMEKAVECFQVATDLAPDFAPAQTRLAECYIELGRYDDAVAPYKRALALRPDDPEHLYGLGLCYAKLRQYDQAIGSLQQAVRFKPDYAQAHHILGLTYLSLGRRYAAVEQYQYLINLDAGLANELSDYIKSVGSTENHYKP